VNLLRDDNKYFKFYVRVGKKNTVPMLTPPSNVASRDLK
jgi:hypothetical protein